MRYWEKVKTYFLDGYDVYSLEVQHKIEYLFFFNGFAIVGLFIYYISRIFNPGGPMILIGDICLFFFVAISLVAIRLKKINSVTSSAILIPVAVLCYNVLQYWTLNEEISQTTLYASLSLLMFGLLYLSFFSIRSNQLVSFTLVAAATLILNCYFLINGPFGFGKVVSALFNLMGALLELGAGFIIARMILKLNNGLLVKFDKKLIQSREQYAALFSNIKDVFCLFKVITDNTGRPIDMMILEVNKSAEEFMNLSRDQMVFKKITEVIDINAFDSEAWIKETAGVAFSGKEIHKSIYSKLFKRWLSIQVFSPEQNYCAMLFKDITVAVEAEYELKRIQERNVALLEAIPDTILVCGKDGFIKTYKRPQVKLIENTKLFRTGINLSESELPVPLIQQIMEAIEEVISVNKLKTMILEIPSESRITYAETRLVPLGDEEVLILFRDLTRRILSEKALVKEKEKAEESDRLKMAFLSNMSHEIRTPMNAIIGFSELLGFNDIDDQERKVFIDQIQSNGALLLNLINDILDLSKIEAGELEMLYSKFEIHKILQDVFASFENEKLVRNKIDIQLILDQPQMIRDIFVTGDEYRFKQVLFNLMGNALKFTAKGSITLGYSLEDKEIVFWVKDTGIGIPEDKHELVFQRFRQADDSHTRTFGGAGLGLAISKNLIEGMGGRIWIKSNDPVGAIFYFALPLTDATITYTDNSSVEANKNPYKWRGKSILIVEEEASNYVVIQNLLAKTGVTIEWASKQEMVFSICNDKIPSLVIFDIDLFSRGDVKLEEELKDRYPTVPIIALKSEQFSLNEPFLSIHINDVIYKPIAARTLLDAIDKYLTI